MRYYRTITLIALILLSPFPNGCGGGKGFTPQLGTAHLQQPGGPYLPGNQQPLRPGQNAICGPAALY